MKYNKVKFQKDKCTKKKDIKNTSSFRSKEKQKINETILRLNNYFKGL